MKFHFSHRLWFWLARLPFRRRPRPQPFVPDRPVWGQAALAHIPAGRSTMDKMGCEMVAVYNLLHLMDRPRPLGQIIDTYETRRWLLLGGHWGADPYAIEEYAALRGLCCTAFRGRASFQAFDRAVQEGEGRVFVLSYWLGDTVFSGAHAVTLTRREGRLWVLNLTNGQRAPRPLAGLGEILTPERFITGYLFR